MPSLRIEHINITVSNPDRTAKFVETLLQRAK